MKWFEGSISDAVSASKAKGAVFVVFIEGTDDASVSTAAAIADPDVSMKLESKDFVAIKLGSGTEEYKLFTEIYRIVPIPSLFFIGGDGRPIEIVAGSANAADILTRIATVETKTKGAVGTTSTNATDISPPLYVASGNPHQAAEVNPPTASSTADTATAAQDILDKAKAMIEKTRLLKVEEEKAKEREKEEERRRVGKEVQELRRWQQDQEMKQMKEDREKEKREDLAARERVKQQIAFDKAERLKKNSEASGKKEPEKVVQNTNPAPTSSTSNVARLQLRMPDGSVVTTQLSASAPLSELRSFVSQHLNQPARNFLMSTTFPRRELLVSEDAVTMADLSLTPTAVILVLPTSSGGVVRTSGSSLFGSNSSVTWLFWTVLAPVFSVFNYVRSFVFGGRASSQPSAGGGDAALKRQQRQQTDNAGQDGVVRGGRPGTETTIRRQGNVHRLAQPQDSSDEENNTWNGNSTQQM